MVTAAAPAIRNGESAVRTTNHLLRHWRDGNKAGATPTLTILPGAGHEDPVLMATQRTPTIVFLNRSFGR